jgi:dihydrodipicolinate synthase/N-acetylneuraminate lyase
MAGTGAESTKVSIELCHQAAEIGAHYASLITPFFFASSSVRPMDAASGFE